MCVKVEKSAPQRSSKEDYGRLLQLLDDCAARAIDETLEGLSELTEPHVARQLSRLLPRGNGLFLGNSMPIRDMDMYADSARHHEDTGSQWCQGQVRSSAIPMRYLFCDAERALPL
jgi:isochorismate synthase/2-succinyl-5-enolpyruvyl-6-hydroxy-3-cyclohexene-1-carboxylate synthase/2-succinyl-6-hydroxy-2,4-cyclohexadiene-1-carboxylate synthase/O-succinylbenzoate synthase